MGHRDVQFLLEVGASLTPWQSWPSPRPQSWGSAFHLSHRPRQSKPLLAHGARVPKHGPLGEAGTKQLVSHDGTTRLPRFTFPSDKRVRRGRLGAAWPCWPRVLLGKVTDPRCLNSVECAEEAHVMSHEHRWEGTRTGAGRGNDSGLRHSLVPLAPPRLPFTQHRGHHV